MGNDRGMIGRLKGNWEEFRDSKPGERFKDRYHRRQEQPGHIVMRVILVILGTILAISSLVLAPLPGPGFATVFLGLAILGGELLPQPAFWTGRRSASANSGSLSATSGIRAFPAR